jgi:hypothetical protein
MKARASMARMKPVLAHPASAPAPKIIYTKRPTVGPSLTLKQRQTPGIGLGLGF